MSDKQMELLRADLLAFEISVRQDAIPGERNAKNVAIDRDAILKRAARMVSNSYQKGGRDARKAALAAP